MGRLRRAGRIGLTLIVAWAFAVCFSTCVAQPYVTPSHSMLPTLRVGDVHLVERWVAPGDLRRGDIVAFHQPPGWHDEPLHRGTVDRWWHGTLVTAGLAEPDHAYIKRVIGLPGDRIECRRIGGPVYRNGRALDEPYLASPSGCQQRYAITVAPATLWVLGDNRMNSADSAWWGQGGGVPFVDVRGKVGPLLYRR